jgi:hypothetical protein
MVDTIQQGATVCQSTVVVGMLFVRVRVMSIAAAIHTVVG